ncbi:MAG: ubiquinol-cytochrome c reductase iron-sulfur subunit [Omnitrophica WOR_2 bacterium]
MSEKEISQTGAFTSASTITRRGFLTLTWKSLLGLSAVLGISGLVRFLDYQAAPDVKTVFDLGSPEQYAPGSRTLIVEAQAVLIYNPNGFMAYSLVCTHLGCQVNVVKDGFACPCHGSLFDLQGQVRRGPATRALRPLRLDQDKDGHIILYTD